LSWAAVGVVLVGVARVELAVVWGAMVGLALAELAAAVVGVARVELDALGQPRGRPGAPSSSPPRSPSGS
jgi:hypothetical protein